MSNVNEYKDIVAYHPGYYIADIIEDMEISQAELAKEIDYKYFVDVIGLPIARSINEKVANLCKYFKVADLRIMLQPDFLVNFRSSASCNNEKNIINSRAWIQTAINISKSIETKPYNAEKLKGYLPELRGMTVKSRKNSFQECVKFLLNVESLLSCCHI